MVFFTRFYQVILITSVALTGAGCAGIALDWPVNESIEKPVPLIDGFQGDRWACQREGEYIDGLSKQAFITRWGEPVIKQDTPTGGVWRYEENWRWCGIWLFAIIPIPFVLPVCSTYDEVLFVDGQAVHSKSRRFSAAFAGIVIAPAGVAVPLPVLTRGGTKTENSSTVTRFPQPEGKDYQCHQELTTDKDKNSKSQPSIHTASKTEAEG